MKRIRLIFSLLLVSSSLGATDAPVPRQWTVDGVAREAVICAPAAARTNAAPLVFVFHGHGGSMQNTVRTFHLHTLWSEAIVVYPQGLKTPGRLTDPEGKRSGWQHDAADHEDRDLKFYDAMLASLRQEFQVDPKRVFATGHSNGGGFTYLLWATRGDTLAAVAPSAAVASRSKQQRLKPKPVLHLGGEQDTLVKFQWQEATMKALRRLNECGEGKPWMKEKWCTLYESRVDAPVVTCIHPGGHKFPAEAPAIIVKFFKQQAAAGPG